jgi:peptidoglycan hydrolase CwlO-like protein
LEPVVQVAIVSVFATIVTTLGVIGVAIINNKSKKDTPPDVDLDLNDILGRLVSMASEIQRKEASIQKLRSQQNEFKQRIHFLELFIEEQKKGHQNDRDDWSARISDHGDHEQEPSPE